MARNDHFLHGRAEGTRSAKHVARRAFASLLSAALLVSGMVFAPITANAAPSGVSKSYVLKAGDNLADALDTNVTEGASATGSTFVYTDNGQLCFPDGYREVKLYRIAAGVRTVSGGSVNDPDDHFGVPYRLYYKDSSGLYHVYDPENPPASASGYAKGIAENLRIELEPDETGSLDTAGLDAVNLSILYAYTPNSNSNNVVYDDLMQVYVQLDGEDEWRGPVGIRSTQLLGGGVLYESTSSGTIRGQFYRIETDNLLDIEGVRDETIKKIRIWPYGQDHYTALTNFFVSELQVNSYADEGAFDSLVPDPKQYYEVSGDTLRAIAVEEALRTASKPWKTNYENGVTVYFSSDTTSRTYKKGVQYHGPTYERVVDSTRELFFSQIDANGIWTGGQDMKNMAGDGDEVFGMDCQTFVFNAISRVSRSYAWSGEHIQGASRTPLVKAEGLIVNDHPKYTDTDIVKLNSNNLQALYESYALAKAGDITNYHGKSGSHVRLIVEDAHVVRYSNGTINPYSSYIYCAHSASDFKYYDKDGNEVSSASATGFAYASTCREKSKHYFDDLATQGNVIYTLDEYTTGQVEKERVEAVLGSQRSNQNFVEGTTNLAIFSNYRIISYQMKLEHADGTPLLKADGVTPVFDPGLTYVKSSYTVALNVRNGALNQALRTLPAGDYRLALTVDSGPIIEEGDTTVPQTLKYFYFSVDDTPLVTPADGDVFFIPGTRFTGYPALGYVIDSDSSDYTVGQKVFVDQYSSSSEGVAAYRGRFWKMENSTFSCIAGYSSASANYTYGYHDVISELDETKMTLQHAPGHTSSGPGCGYRFSTACGNETASTRSHECASSQNYSADTKIIDLRSDVVAGKADAAQDVAAVYELTQAGTAVINTYAPGGTSSSGTAAVIIVLDPDPYVDFDALKHEHTVVVDAGVGATCTDPGLTEGKHCSVCNEVLVAQEVIPATGHTDENNDMKCDTCSESLGVVVTVNTMIGDTVSGTKTYEYSSSASATLDLMSDFGYALLGSLSDDEDTTPVISAMPGTDYVLVQLLVDGEDKTADVVGGRYYTFTVSKNHTVTATFAERAEFYGVNMVMGNDLAVNFAIVASDVDALGGVSATMVGADGTTQTMAKESWETRGDYYVIPYTGLAAKQMGDDIAITICDDNGNAITKPYTRSIRGYIQDNLDEAETTLKTLFVDALNYGAAAQTDFNYKTDDLVNSWLSETQKAYATQELKTCEDSRVKGTNYVGTNLVLENRISMQMAFANVADETLRAVVTFTDHYGESVTKEIPNADIADRVAGESTLRIVKIEDLVVADGRQLVTCELYNANDELVGSAVDSMESYINRMASGDYEWMKSIMMFSDSAHAYLHRNDSTT